MEGLLKHILYINLEHRIDRLHHVVGELGKIGVVHGERFPAIKMAAGNVGCTLSHIKCLELAKKNEWPLVFICEDDITFTNPRVFCESLRKFAESGIQWDVLIVGGNNCPPFQVINDFCIRVQNVQTTTGYIVRKEYYDVLLANFKDGVSRLMREPDKKKQYSIDIYWKQLQQVDRWFLLTPLTVVQNYDYSDIEGKMTDYRSMMLDVDKRELIEKFMKDEEEKRRFSLNFL
jgi:hypothetical protein